MHVPIPTNRLVSLTLVGALLTTLVAGALAFPGLGLVTDQNGTQDAETAPEQVDADAPTPNQEFTPAVQTQSRGEEYEDEYEEGGEHGDYEDDDYEDEEDDGYEDEEDDGYEDEDEDGGE